MSMSCRDAVIEQAENLKEQYPELTMEQVAEFFTRPVPVLGDTLPEIADVHLRCTIFGDEIVVTNHLNTEKQKRFYVYRNGKCTQPGHTHEGVLNYLFWNHPKNPNVQRMVAEFSKHPSLQRLASETVENPT